MRDLINYDIACLREQIRNLRNEARDYASIGEHENARRCREAATEARKSLRELRSMLRNK